MFHIDEEGYSGDNSSRFGVFRATGKSELDQNQLALYIKDGFLTRLRCVFLILLLPFALPTANAQVLNFGSVSVGTAAPVQTLTYTFSSATTLLAVNILTGGAAGLDYSDGGNSTCTANSAYTLGQTCVVNVAFTPSAPGIRPGAVSLFAQGSNPPLTTWYLSGTGQSGAVMIDPGAQSTVATLNSGGQGYGAAIDAGGNVYVADHGNSQVMEFAAGSFVPTTVVGSGLSGPTAVALDGAGNLYISDTGNGRVVTVPNEQGSLNSGDMSAVSISGLVSPAGLAADGSGNLYVADAGSGNVFEVAAGGAQSTVVSGLTNPSGVAVDAAGNLYVISNNQVFQYPTNGSPTPIGNGYSNPTAVAVDASGAVYVADAGAAQIFRVAPGGAPQATLLAGLGGPQGVALDASGNVYVTDSGNVYEVNRNQPAPLAFAGTNVGSVSTPQILTVSDGGNQPLTLSNLAISTNFGQVPSGGADCTSTTQLTSSENSAAQCLIAVTFAPTMSGSLNGSVTLTDNALNNPASTQTVQMSGSGLLVAQSITFPTIPTQTYGVGPITLNATASSGLAVSYIVTSGPATVSGNQLTITGAGSVTVVASQSGNTQYAPATPAPQSFTVNQASQTITFPSIPTQTCGVGSITLNATASSGLPVSYAVTSGPATISGNVLTITGVGSVTVQASQTGNSNYLAATPVPQTFTVIPEATTVDWSTPAPITYGTALGSAQLDATATPVSAGTYVYSPPAKTVLNAGNQTLSVRFTPSNSDYAPSTGSVTLQVNQAKQSVKFTVKAPGEANYGSSFTVAAVSTSELPVSFSSSGVCTNSGPTFTMGNTPGKCDVMANQSGNINYSPALTVTEITNASGKAAQKVTFTGAPATAPYGSTFTVTANSNSGITPKFTVTGPCAISKALVTITSGSGTCAMTAYWPGNNVYLPATAIQDTGAVQAQPTVTFTGAPATAPYESAFTVTANSNSGVTPTLSTSGPCWLAGTKVTITASSGTCTTTANWAANNDYLAATLVQNTTAIQAASIITWPTPTPVPYPTPLTGTQLDATANVSGTFVYSPPTGTVLQGGNQTLSVQFTPRSSNYAPATDSVSLQVTCSAYQSGPPGPPFYGGLRGDPCPAVIGNIPSLWTNFSKDYGFTGAGTVATNSMGLKIARVTDGNTDSTHPGASYMNNYSGGDGDQHWAIDHSMFALGRQGASVTYVYAFNDANMQSTQLQKGGKPFTLPSSLVAFGQTPPNAHKVWVFGTSANCVKTGPCVILQYDLASCLSSPTDCSPPTPTTIYDFQQGTPGQPGAGCLAGLNVGWVGVFRVSFDDTLFSLGFSTVAEGIQGTGTIVAGYATSNNPNGTGCRVWNTGTTPLTGIGPTGTISPGTVVGEFGPTGSMTMTGCTSGYSCPGGADQFTLHGVDSIPADSLVHVSSDTCLSGSCCSVSGGCPTRYNEDAPYFWTFASLQTFAMGTYTSGGLSGHECDGYNSLVHGLGLGVEQAGFIALTSPNGLFAPSILDTGGNDSPVIANPPTTDALILDMHCSWSADNTSDTMPILVSTTTACLGNQNGRLNNTCTPPNNKPNNGCVIPADIASSSWPSAGPSCGTGNLFSGPLVNEVLIYQTNNNPGSSVSACVTTNGTTNNYEPGAPPCTQDNVLRLGNSGISALNPGFNGQNATIDWSPDGLFYTVTTDWWCTLGASVLKQDTICGGVDWQQNTAYSVGDIITPLTGNNTFCTYTASGTPPLISGSTEPTGWGKLTGGACPAQIPATGLDGNITWVRVGAIGMQNARYDVLVGATSLN